MAEEPERLLLSARAAAKALSLSERTLWACTAPRGPIPCLRAGKRVLYPVERLRAWIDAATNQPTPDGQNIGGY